MKTRLTKEQSQRLIELGLGTSTTVYAISETGTYCGYDREIVVTDGGYLDDYVSKERVFTLDDLLRILPKWIKYRNMLLWLNIRVDQYEEKWCAEYKGGTYDCDEADTFQCEEELVDCLYILLIHIIENNYIKLN